LFVGGYANHCDHAFVGSCVRDYNIHLDGYDFDATDYVYVNRVEHNQHRPSPGGRCDRRMEHLLGCMGGGSGLR
jgi:hypothetical protein